MWLPDGLCLLEELELLLILELGDFESLFISLGL